MSLSQKEYGELRGLYESVYTPKVEITEELIDDIVDELVEELVEEGYSEEEAIEIVDEATDLYIDSVLCEVSDSYYDSAVRASKKAAQGIDKAARQKRRAGQVRYAKRKAGDAIKAVKAKAKGAVAGAQIAGSIAKDEARRAGRKAAHAVTSAPGKAKATVDRKKKETKRGIKGFIKRQAQKVVNRMSEEVEALKATGKFSDKEIEAFMEAEIQELYKGKHGQSDKEYADSRSQGGKMVSGDSKQSGAEYTHGRRVKAANPGMQPDVGGKTKPKSQGKMDRGTRADLEYRKANLKKEEVESVDEALTGERLKKAIKKPGGTAYTRKVSADPEKRATRGGRGGESDFGAGDRGAGNKAARRAGTYQEEIEVEEGYKEIDAKKHGRMYDRYKKLRSAAIKDARDSGEASGTNRMKMGKMSAVIDKSSENLRKKQTRDQLTGRG